MAETTELERALTRGSVIADRFKLIEPLGQGGMGTVWKAWHLALNSHVALKLVDPEIARSESGRARFQREAQAAAAIRSPHVVQILDHGVDGQTPYIAMELLEGESLADRLQRGTLDLAETTRILTHVSRAVGRAHAAGLIHRDLKPDNIFLIHNDDEEVTKVLDFGIAKAKVPELNPSDDSTRTGAILGTPFYMSPEQLRGDKELDHRADLWAMGVIAYECLCGQRPFVSDTFADLVMKICSEPAPRPSATPGVPELFDAWFAKAVSRAPADRFQSARELSTALRRLSDPSFSAAHDTTLVADVEAGSRDGTADSNDSPSTDSALAHTQHASTRSEAPAPPARRNHWLMALGALAVVGLLAWAWLQRTSSLGVAAESAANPLQPASASAAPLVAPAAPAASESVRAAASASVAPAVPVSAKTAPTAKPPRAKPALTTAKPAPVKAAPTTAKPPLKPSASAAERPPAASATGKVDLGI